MPFFFLPLIFAIGLYYATRSEPPATQPARPQPIPPPPPQPESPEQVNPTILPEVTVYGTAPVPPPPAAQNPPYHRSVIDFSTEFFSTPAVGRITTGKYYRLKIQVPLSAYGTFVGTDQRKLDFVRQQLINWAGPNLGFNDATIFLRPEQLDPSWPPDAYAGIDIYTAYAQGYWRHEPYTFNKPGWLINMWEY